MVHAGQVLETGTGSLEFLVTRHESAGRLHEMRATYDPGSPYAPGHLHPTQTETFTVEQGAMRFVVDGTEHVVEAGSTIVIAPGQVHQVRNEHDDRPAVTRWRTEPALCTGEFFEELMAARGDLDRVLAVIASHPDEFRFA